MRATKVNTGLAESNGSHFWVYGVIHFTSPAGWVPVHRDQLRAQRSVTSMGKLYLSQRLYKWELEEVTPNSLNRKRAYRLLQLSILSVTLFCRIINSIVRALGRGIDCSVYVDDFLICYRSKHIHIEIQRCLNKFQDWADIKGLKILYRKNSLHTFCHLRRLHPDTQLFLNVSRIPAVEKVKFHGIIFDRKLSFFSALTLSQKQIHKSFQYLVGYMSSHTPLGVQTRSFF